MLTAERLREVLRYDPETGVWIWIKTLAPRGKEGTRAGYVRPDGYRLIRIDGRLYRSNRLAHLYMTGEWPPALIDHKNLDSSDDRWLNLRAASGTENGANCGPRKRNKSGFKGVSWSKGNSCWVAFLQANGRNRYLGYFADKRDAASAYADAAAHTFGEFARID